MVSYPTDQGNDAGAIPVRVVSTPDAPVGGPYPNDQGNDAGAIPVRFVYE
jgi:hypothetical protein